MPFVPDKPVATTGRFVPDAQVAPPVAAPAPDKSIWDTVSETLAPSNLRRSLVGAGDIALSGISSVGAGIKGATEGLGATAGELVTRLRGDALPAEEFNPINVAANTINESTYQPRTEAGQKLGEAIGNSVGLVGKGYGEIAKLADAPDSVVTGLEDYVPVALNLGAAIGGGPKIGAAAERAVGPSEAAVRPAVPDINNPVQTARAAGYNLRPSDINAMNPSEKAPGTFRERFQHAEDTKKATTLGNQAQSTTLAGEELGLQGVKRIGDNELNAAKAPSFQIYEAADAALQRIAPSAEFSNLVAQGADAAKLKGAPSTTKVIGALRRKANSEINSDVVATQESGYAKRDLADQIDESFGQQLEAMGEKDLYTQYQMARQNLAKVNDVETALKGGQIDATVLARLDKRYPGRLTGRLKIIADTGANFPNVTGSSLKTAAAGGGELPASKTGIIASAGKAIARNIPGLDVMSERFQNKFGTEATPVQRSYFGDVGKIEPQIDGLTVVAPDGLPFTETPGIAPGRAQMLSGDLGLAPEAVPGAQVLPEAPSRLTAEAIPAPRGDLPFRGTPDTSLAGDLGLAPERAAPEGVPFTTEPNLSLAEGLGLAPPRLREQGKLKVEALQRPELSLTAPPGPKSAPAVQHAVTKGGQHTFRVEDGGELIAKDLPDEGRFQIVESKVPEGKRGEGRGSALYRAAYEQAARNGRQLVSDNRVSEPAQKRWADLEKQGIKIRRNPATKQASGELVSKSELKPVFEVIGTPATE